MDGSTSRTESRHSRTINLYCPSLSKLSTIVVPRDDNRIDIGAIARIFGLDPTTVKLNGHFISRGVDLIASSITWKSLLSFFSARRLPTGVASSESGGFYSQSSSPFAAALRVDGKKSRPKRSHDGAEIGIDNQYHHRQLDDNGVDYSQSGDYIMSKKKQRVREIEAECERDGSRGSIYREEEDGVVGLKRKQEQLESNSCSSPLKRLKGKGDAFSQMFSWSINCKNGCRGKENTAELLEGAKRAREDDEVTLALGSSCKRVQRRPWAQQLPAR